MLLLYDNIKIPAFVFLCVDNSYRTSFDMTVIQIVLLYLILYLFSTFVTIAHACLLVCVLGYYIIYFPDVTVFSHLHSVYLQNEFLHLY